MSQRPRISVNHENILILRCLTAFIVSTETLVIGSEIFTLAFSVGQRVSITEIKNILMVVPCYGKCIGKILVRSN
jgi:hypothetical protein